MFSLQSAITKQRYGWQNPRAEVLRFYSVDNFTAKPEEEDCNYPFIDLLTYEDKNDKVSSHQLTNDFYKKSNSSKLLQFKLHFMGRGAEFCLHTLY